MAVSTFIFVLLEGARYGSGYRTWKSMVPEPFRGETVRTQIGHNDAGMACQSLLDHRSTFLPGPVTIAVAGPVAIAPIAAKAR